MNLRFGITTSRLVKSVIFILLLIAASCFSGYVCHQIGQLGDTIFSPSMDTLYLFLWLLLAIALVAITAGLVAVLVRPLWWCFIAFFLSGLAVFFIWGLNLISLAVAVIYFLAGLLYSQGVANGIKERISFSVRPIQDSQTILLMALIIAACALFYSGYAAQIESEGFTTPPFVIDMVKGVAEGQIEGSADLTPAEKEQFMTEFIEQFKQQVEDGVKPYQQFIPIIIAVMLLGTLMTVIGFLSWIPPLILRAIFAVLAACHVTRVVTETQEVKRLTID